jgi:RNA polymerase sigma factor (sigma-70 family)
VEDRPPQEAELVARAKRGELDAYEEIVRLHQTIAFRTAWVITRSAADAEEAAQDGFVKAHAALGRFREGSPFRPWLLTIVANEARNRRRSATRREMLALRSPEAVAGGEAVEPSPEAAILASERRTELLDAVNRLPDADREVIAYRHLLELSEAETAAALGVPVGTAKSRLSRAMDRLRASLAITDAGAAPGAEVSS